MTARNSAAHPVPSLPRRSTAPVCLEALAGEVCLRCGKPFEPRATNHLFCSKVCQAEAHSGLPVVLPSTDLGRFPEASCAWCGGSFLLRKEDQKYCSRRCNATALRDRAIKKRHAQLAAQLRCVDCGGALSRPTRKSCKRCPACNDRHWRAYRIEYCRRWRGAQRSV
ncbi:putative CHY-type Zn-finger protein [Ancylobacter vacuolatus]|uniref:CHY-type Zn-finger protein n=1 Tax=Ancylobacter vacuolatus TaxID=223389 RepID=A0ABU0DHG8_9HYPH|nr:putative CHY-type Zn-finger protein [Ancylobacter vacuolatus]